MPSFSAAIFTAVYYSHCTQYGIQAISKCAATECGLLSNAHITTHKCRVKGPHAEINAEAIQSSVLRFFIIKSAPQTSSLLDPFAHWHRSCEGPWVQNLTKIWLRLSTTLVKICSKSNNLLHTVYKFLE